jgi:hypothetical protein
MTVCLVGDVGFRVQYCVRLLKIVQLQKRTVHKCAYGKPKLVTTHPYQKVSGPNYIQ